MKEDEIDSMLVLDVDHDELVKKLIHRAELSVVR
jgi:hypothetical protein